MAFFLQGKEYWKFVTLAPPEPKTGETETFIKRYDEWISKDWRAKGFICQAVDKRYVGQIKNESYAKAMWKKIESLFEAKAIDNGFMDRVRFYQMTLSEGDDLLEFISEIEKLN